MSHYYHDETISTLRQIADEPSGMSISQVGEAMGLLRDTAKKRIDNLHTKELVESYSAKSVATRYCVTAKGLRLIERMAPKELGSIAQPRTLCMTVSYVPQPIFTRPGADDHLQCLSRRGEEFIAHRGPLSLAGA